LSLPEPVDDAGASLLDEIREQPAALRRLLAHEDAFGRVADAARERGTPLVRMVGHGSSDNAASYGVYAFGLLAGWTALRDSISLTVYYDADVELRDSLVLALSQSGQTRDVVEYVRRARERGAVTVAITNDPSSDLASAADHVLPLEAGPERSIAATKTYLNQVAALALLAAYTGGRGPEIAAGIRRAADDLEAVLPALEERIPQIAVPFAFVGRMFVIGRGPEYATAREIALKLLETCRIAAEPLTSTAMAHGPVAALDALFPVWAIASRDQNLQTVREAAERARTAGAGIVATGAAADEIVGAAYRLPTPDAAVPLLSPLLSVVPGQLFAWALARAKGLDPDHPSGLAKITLAR
jgi:glucosamine--fructose-6-phosphate aminotransferase (isomerizing)